MGWKQLGQWRDIGYEWITLRKEHVLVPNTQRIYDYSVCVQKVLELFVNASLAIEDVVEMANNGPSDVIRNRIDIPKTNGGSLPAEMAASKYNGMVELLKATAGAVGKRKEPRIPAKEYLDACRVGQSEFGSYVMKLYAPIIVQNTACDDGGNGREVTIAAATNFSFLADDAYNAELPLPAAMTAQVAAAIAKIRPHEDLFSGDSSLTVSYTRTADLLPKELIMPAKGIVIPLRPELFDRAERIEERLNKGTGVEEMTLQGHIVDLHMDPPGTKELKYQITIKAANPNRRVTMRLLPVEYRRASEWQVQKKLVELTARIDKRRNLWTVVDYKSLVPIQAEKREDGLQLFPLDD